MSLYRPRLKTVVELENQQASEISQFFEAAPDIKLCGAEKTAYLGIDRLWKTFEVAAVDQSMIHDFMNSYKTWITFLASAAVVSVTALLTERHALNVGEFITLYMLSSLFIEAAGRITSASLDLEETRADHNNWQNIVKIPPKGFPHAELNNHKIHVPAFCHPFSTEADESQTSKNLINPKPWTIEPGAHVAITGITGSGKTTMAELIGGIRDPLRHDTSVSIGRVACCDLSDHDLSKVIFMASHQGEFLRGSLWQSVMFGVKEDEHSHHQVIKYMNKLELQKLIPRIFHDDFFQVNFSQGEKKRLGLLRALILNRPITILDEPTESLDSETAQKIWRLIAEVFAQKTLICLTHDLTARHLFDQIVTIENYIITMNHMN